MRCVRRAVLALCLLIPVFAQAEEATHDDLARLDASPWEPG